MRHPTLPDLLESAVWDAGAEDIAQAIAAVAVGQMVRDPAAQAGVVDNLQIRDPAAAGMPSSLPDSLTKREAEILGLIAQGLSNAEIAAHIVVSEATVKTHVNHIFAKTGVRDRAQAGTYAYRTGLARASCPSHALRPGNH